MHNISAQVRIMFKRCTIDTLSSANILRMQLKNMYFSFCYFYFLLYLCGIICILIAINHYIIEIMKKLLLIFLFVLTATLAARADVTINATNFPDANFRAYLMSEYPSGVITTAQLNARTELEVNNKNISNMKGVEYFAQLTRLSCYGNNLTSIDVSNNLQLTYLNVYDNDLESINVVNNSRLEQLYLHRNKLTSVTVTYHSALRTLWVRDNPNLIDLNCCRNAITNLDIANCTSLKTLMCFENSSLSIIQGLESCTALTYIDCEDCAITNLSGVSSLNSLEKLYCRNNQLRSLDVANKHYLSILRLNGNTLLTTVDCSSCALTELYVSGCSAITTLLCYGNSNLSEINGLANCISMKKLSCYSCSLTNLPGLNGMDDLTNVICSNNKLTSLTLSEKSQLEQLWVDDNLYLTSLETYGNPLLTSLNVTGCTQLQTLYCNNNASLAEITGLEDCSSLKDLKCFSCALTTLDGLQGKTKLEKVSCSMNQLTSLNVQGCTKLNSVICILNQINFEGMGTLVGSLPFRSGTTPGTLIAVYEGDSNEHNVITMEQAIKAYNKNWSVEAAVGSTTEPIVSLDKILDATEGSIHFSTDGEYPWILAVDDDGTIYARSSNDGVENSVSTLTATVTVTVPGTSVLTTFKARGEGSSPIYDACTFKVDGNQVFSFGSLGNYWTTNNASLEVGTHTLTWTYSKDGSVNPAGDFFAVSQVSLYIPSVTRGDVNNDGSVNISDVTTLIDYLLSGNASGVNLDAADCNQDSSVNISDVTTLIDYLLSGSW